VKLEASLQEIRCELNERGKAMDSTFIMFAVIMLGILVGGIIVYKKSV